LKYNSNIAPILLQFSVLAGYKLQKPRHLLQGMLKNTLVAINLITIIAQFIT